MVVRKLGWRWLALGLLLGLAWLGCTSNVSAQGYVGDFICSNCHKGEYDNYKQHGHPWMEVHTGGTVISASNNPFASAGWPVPTLPTAVKSWTGVQDIVAYFKDVDESSVCNVLCSDGKLYEAGGSSLTMPFRCNNCHNTNCDPNGHAYGVTAIAGSWSLPGIQCEQCHGPSATMQIPDVQVCTNCHSSGDQNQAGQFTYRIPVDSKTLQFTNHHPEGDEYRRSPHKNLGCTLCHDPHKSVWHDKGGTKFSTPGDDKSTGTMCLTCHTKRVRGSMGDLGLLCVDCHMPENTAATAGTPHTGTRMTHIFRINPLALSGSSNIVVEPNSTGKATNYWGPTDPAGDSFLTVDQVCTNCHNNMTVAQMATYATTIHGSSMVDLTINGTDQMQTVGPKTKVTVQYAVDPGASYGKPATWYMAYQGPKGWVSYNGSTWKSGLKPFKTNIALSSVKPTTVYSSTLAAGSYTFWMYVYVSDGSEAAASVPVYVTKK